MRTKKGQHRERLLMDLHKNSGLNRDGGEAPRARMNMQLRRGRQTPCEAQMLQLLQERVTPPKEKNSVIQLCITSVPDTGKKFDYVCKTCCGLTLNPVPAGVVGIQNKTSEL